MKINHTIRDRMGIISGSEPKKADGAAPVKQSPAKADANVHIGTNATFAQALSNSSEVVDMAKISEIKLAISEGRFKVNPEVVADRLLESVRELILARNEVSNK
ncbi:MAG: flagellar biosynthesis anti-sigma factor FlgM [Nitrosomonas sp.]|nr:flagellar biosynthesis anti-sigma factor FlgM [Nitrosomonas sp.]